jgi:secreted PhoX family phosphatase
MSVDRRSVLRGAALGGAAAVGPFAGFANAQAAGPGRGGPRAGHGSGALVPVEDARDGVVRLHLPRGFGYRSFHDTSGEVVLDDGTKLPGRHDGMGAFAGPDDTVLLVRNHEINNPQPAFGPGSHYDDMGGGGTTTIQVSKDGEVVRAFTSLSGTMMNCSGGQMPWGAWITCEETVNGPDVGPDFTGASNTALQKRHGYIFEVPVSSDPATGRSEAEAITQAGRFAHEAVSYDPEDGYLYLTEDNFAFPSGFYRYKPKAHPDEVGHLDNDGTLQMLKVKDQWRAHLEARQRPGATYDVEWVDIDDPNPEFDYEPGIEAPTPNDTALTYVGDQGRARGAAHFSRLEGQVYDDGVVYFTSTQGGGKPMEGPDSSDGYGRGFGQVWAYDTRRQQLRCVYQSHSRERLDFPDNVTTSPRGTLVVCEDHDERNYLRGLTQEGRIWSIARNAIEGRMDDEFAGSTFSPDGHTLFVNIQSSKGMTFAIWGPWARIGV